MPASLCPCPAPCQSLAVSLGYQENVKVLMVPVPVPVYIPVPLNMYSQHTPVPLTLSLPVCIILFEILLFVSDHSSQWSFPVFFWQLPIPLVVPPEKKDIKDAAVQSESVTEDKQIEVPVSAAGTENVWFSAPKHHISMTNLRKAVIGNISIVKEFKKL